MVDFPRLFQQDVGLAFLETFLEKTLSFLLFAISLSFIEVLNDYNSIKRPHVSNFARSSYFHVQGEELRHIWLVMLSHGARRQSSSDMGNFVNTLRDSFLGAHKYIRGIQS